MLPPHRPSKVSWKEEPEIIKAVEFHVTCHRTDKINSNLLGVVNRPFKICVPSYPRSKVLDMKIEGQKFIVKDLIPKEASKELGKSGMSVVRDAHDELNN